MSEGETNLNIILKSIDPILNKGEYVFCTIENILRIDFSKIISFIKEENAYSIIIGKEYALQLSLPFSESFAWITLSVHSSLEAVGLTALFSRLLADNGLSCNVVAGYYHDHIFVLHPFAQQAMELLKGLARHPHP